MKTRLSIAVLQGVTFGLLMSLFSFFTSIKLFWLQGLVSGILFGLLMYFFNNSKKIDEQTKLENVNDDKIIYSDLANHFKGLEAVGGKLYALNDKLVFKSHLGNIQNHTLEIPIEQVLDVKRSNTLGIIPNQLLVKTVSGEEKFVVYNTRKWEKVIEGLINV